LNSGRDTSLGDGNRRNVLLKKKKVISSQPEEEYNYTAACNVNTTMI